MNYFIVDAFTSEPFGGNPAGVVLLGKDAPFPDDDLMLKIAAELRYSETAFVQQNSPVDFTVRYFTPVSEVDLCGHATIATFGVLLHEGIVADGTTCINHTLAGDLTVNVGEQVMMQMASPIALETPIDSQCLNRIMGLSDNHVIGLSPEVISTGLPDIIMSIASVDLLQRLSPDMEALTTLSRELNVVGVHAFAMAEDGYTAHVRNFAPLYGVPEESATGTANAALTHYLALHGIVSGTARCQFLQGEAMGRPSIITTEIRHVGGPSRIVAQGTLYP